MRAWCSTDFSRQSGEPTHPIYRTFDFVFDCGFFCTQLHWNRVKLGAVAGLKGGELRRRSVASVALLAATAIGPANALDLGTPPNSWAGCYLGITGGGNWGSSQVFYELLSSPAVGLAETSGINLSGGLFGGTTGCGFQVRQWVVGIENDISWTNLSTTAGTIPPFNPLATFQVSESWLDTLRVRFGYGGIVGSSTGPAAAPSPAWASCPAALLLVAQTSP